MINWLLLISNLLIIGTAIWGLVHGSTVLKEEVDDLKAIARMSSEEAPCGLPTPDLYYMRQGLGLDWTHPFSGFDYTTEGDNLRYSLCDVVEVDASTQEQKRLVALAHVLKVNRTLIENLATDTEAVVDAKVENHLCNFLNRRHGPGRHSTDLFGDIAVRIGRAYIAAQPAFKRLATDNIDGTSCMGSNHPFAPAGCPNAQAVVTELDNAATYPAIVVGAAALPSLDTMLYRLLVLSVVAQKDRDVNAGSCFSNVYGYERHEYCSSIFTDAVSGTAPSLTWSNGATFPTYYSRASTVITARESVYVQQTETQISTCNGEQGDIDTYHPPPPAPVRDYGFGENRLSPAIPPPPPLAAADLGPLIVGECTAMLQFGLYDQNRLFGIPDVLEPFVSKQHNFGGVGADYFYKLLFRDRLTNNLNSPQHANFELLLYTAARVSLTSIYTTMAGACIGFFFGYALVPVYAFLCVNVLNARKITNGGKQVFVRPEPTFAYYATYIVVILVVFWLVWVDPGKQVHYQIAGGCKGWRKNMYSGSYTTSWSRQRHGLEAEWMSAIILGITAIIPLFYSVVLTACQTRTMRLVKENKRRIAIRNDAAQTAAVLVVIVGIAAVGGTASRDGITWRNAAEKHQYMADTAITDHFTKECEMVAIFAFFWSAAVASVGSRWCVAKLPKYVLRGWILLTLVLVGMPLLFRYSWFGEGYIDRFTLGSTVTKLLTFTELVIFGVFLVMIWFSVKALGKKRDGYEVTNKPTAEAEKKETDNAAGLPIDRKLERKNAGIDPAAVNAVAAENAKRSRLAAFRAGIANFGGRLGSARRAFAATPAAMAMDDMPATPLMSIKLQPPARRDASARYTPMLRLKL